jgi:hypothetical protein
VGRGKRMCWAGALQAHAGERAGTEKAKTKKGEGEMSFPFFSFFFYFKAYFKTILNAV